MRYAMLLEFGQSYEYYEYGCVCVIVCVCVDVCCVVHVRPVWSRTCASCHALTTCFAGLHFILQILDETPVTADFPLKSKCE